VAGSSNVTLTQAQYGNGVITLTGALTGNISVILPTQTGAWTVSNQSSGAYSITLKTASGTGVVVAQGYNTEIYGDGTNILLAKSDYITWFLGLPTSLPGTSGVLWNNGGILSKS
jgi:hypothetical protein